MFKKLYSSIKKYIIDNHNFLLFLVLFTIVLNIRVPYVIKRPGGIISLDNRIEVNGKNIKNNYYTSYVSMNDGTVLSFIMGKIMPKWEVVKEKEYVPSNVSYEELAKIEKFMMYESNNTAIKTVYDKLGIDYKLDNKGLYVYYSHKDYDNNLQVGDRIKTCNGTDIKYFDELKKCIYESKNDYVTLNIIRDDKEEIVKSYIKDVNNNKLIGVNIYQDYKLDSDEKVEIKTLKREYGSSGGLMTTLAIYDALSEDDLSRGRKISGTGTIEFDGSVGEIDGIKYKILGAAKKNVDIFFVPKDNYKEALKYKKKYNLKIKLVKVETLDDAINYLKKK